MAEETTAEQQEGTSGAGKSGTDSVQKRKAAFEDLKKTFFTYLDRGVEVSKKGLKSAGSAISDFGDKSVKRIETAQFKLKLEKAYAALGKTVHSQLGEKDSDSTSDSDEIVVAQMAEIDRLLSEIAKLEEALKSEKAGSSKEKQNTDEG